MTAGSRDLKEACDRAGVGLDYTSRMYGMKLYGSAVLWAPDGRVFSTNGEPVYHAVRIGDGGSGQDWSEVIDIVSDLRDE